ncbi:MAG: dTDP-4-dehydrorhamnose reductase [Actinomycetota bacterium]|nr:dTDP-4-dehydrorhamnose reductase [Actinomycetota bacterium]
MKILLTGAEGQLGRDFLFAAAARHEVVAHDVDLDITNRKAVLERVASVSPHIVVNAAAFTDVDRAELEEVAAYRTNALGPYNLALACREEDIPFLHVSTDFVFRGDSTEPYTEFDSPAPMSVYGKSKYAGECYVRSLLNRYYICRTSWLFGVSGKNFVKTMIEKGKTEPRVKVVDDQEGCPTYSRDLAFKLLEIIEKGIYGIYHVSNSGSCTWYQFTRDIFDIAMIDTPVSPISTEEISRLAPRPKYSVMRSVVLEMQGIEPMRPYREALEDFILRDLPEWEKQDEKTR